MDISLRPVKEEDCDLLFNWANDELVRKNSFNTNIITYERHKKWFYDKLNSQQSIIYICCNRKEPIGQIRVDIADSVGIITYSIAREYRGKGYGTQLLIKIVDSIKDSNIKVDKLIGRVKYDNISSQKAFQKAGYNSMKKEEYIEYYKFID